MPKYRTARHGCIVLLATTLFAAGNAQADTPPSSRGKNATATINILRPLTLGQLQRIIALNRKSGREALIRAEIAKAFSMNKTGEGLEAQQLLIDLDIGVKNAFIEPLPGSGPYPFSTFRPPNGEGEHVVFQVGSDLRLKSAIRLDKDDVPVDMPINDARKLLDVVFDEWVQTLDLLELDKSP